MKPQIRLAALLVLCGATSAFAHRVDEYLQSTMFAVERDRVAINMRLSPGVEVLDKVLAAMDLDGNDVISATEQRSYAEKVGNELSLSIDGRPVPLRLSSFAFPEPQQMTEGLGEIVLDFVALAPPGGAERRLDFENHHLPAISVFLVNCLVPSDPTIRVIAQDRNYEQSVYRLDYTQQDEVVDNAQPNETGPTRTSRIEATGSASLIKAFVYHGVRHILTGYDHLLFVTALVLAAATLWDLVKVVGAFTLAHTVTLSLAALELIALPAWVVEPLIAASIVFVAIQNVVWPDQAVGWSRLGAAFFFGLFHGLGFAGGLLDAMREMPGGMLLTAIVAFSIGVEVGHQTIVLPLFALLKAARAAREGTVERSQLRLAIQRIGSAGVSVAGIYYLCLQL